MAISLPNVWRALSIISRGEAFSSFLASSAKSSVSTTSSVTSATIVVARGTIESFLFGSAFKGFMDDRFADRFRDIGVRITRSDDFNEPIWDTVKKIFF